MTMTGRNTRSAFTPTADDSTVPDPEITGAECGVFVFCERGIVQVFTPMAERLFGYSGGEIIGKSIHVLMPGTGFSGDVQGTGVEGEKRPDPANHGHLTTARTRAGATFPVHFSYSEFQTGDRSLFIGVASRIPETGHSTSQSTQSDRSRVSLHQELNTVNQSSMFHELMSGIAHQVSQPLMAITAYADVTRRFSQEANQDLETLRETLEKIVQQAERIARVVAELRNLAPGFLRVSGTTQFEALLADVRGIADAEARGFGCALEWDHDNELPAVRADATQIQHVLLLLLRNSFESFLPTMRRLRKVVVRVNVVERMLQVTVEDNGCGITDEQRDTLYYPFTSSKQNRIGIGLAVCNTIIFNHGGRIWHERGSDGGCRVLFTLPVTEVRSPQ